jgi:hypothetical protein
MSLDKFTWQYFVLCIAIIISGIFAVVGMVGLARKSGRIVGGGFSGEYTYTLEHFNYSAPSIGLTRVGQTNTYEYSVDLLRFDDFDGQKNKYLFYINDHLGYETEIFSRAIKSKFCVEFYNSDGSVAMTSTLKFSIEFFSDRTKLTIWCEDGGAAASYWLRFFQSYNLRLRAEIKGVL